jgi:8-oxo-dGTP diphosphatase
MKVIDVVAGVIFSVDKSCVLLALRKPDQHQGNLWEFPGGKMEAGETQAEALTRELKEEVAISVVDAKHRRTLEHRYSDRQVRLHFWDVLQFSGEEHGCEGQQLAWVALDELATLAFPEANQLIVEELANL